MFSKLLCADANFDTCLGMHSKESFHLQLLSQELEGRLKRNPQYSLRSFARDLSVAPSWLSEVLAGKKGISKEKALELTQRLGLSRSEEKAFVLSVKAAHSRRSQDRQLAASQFQKIKDVKSSSSKISAAEFSQIHAWYYYAILELVELEDFDETEKWLAKRLNLPLKLVSRAVQKLISMNLLEQKNGKLRARAVESETDFDLSSTAIKSYHKEVLDLAGQALFEQDIQQREFINMTLAFDVAKIAEAKECIRQFQKEFGEKFYHEVPNKNAIYQFSVQLFRLDQKEK